MNGALGESGIWSRTVVLGGGTMALLLAVIKPGSTNHLSFLEGLAHWIAHIGIGVFCAVIAMRSLQSFTRQTSPLFLLLVSGSIGAWLFAPLALGLEQAFPSPPLDDDPGWLDRLEARSGVWAVLAEGLQVWPQFVLVWVVLNLPPVLAEFGSAQEAGTAPGGGAEKSTVKSLEPAPATDEGVTASPLLERLPPAIGRQLVSASSDLHYLNVHTTQGKAMIIGSLNALEQDLEDRGMRIHRGHWVALDQVRRVDRSGRGWICETSDGRKLPISRRRVSEVRERLGSGFVRQDAEFSESS